MAEQTVRWPQIALQKIAAHLQREHDMDLTRIAQQSVSGVSSCTHDADWCDEDDDGRARK